ncbi:MAG: hypothetical protein KDA72_19050 [Planctomycetales bacterium]|nr:hypothetical protein [Planctomycetales bacterium]
MPIPVDATLEQGSQKLLDFTLMASRIITEKANPWFRRTILKISEGNDNIEFRESFSANRAWSIGKLNRRFFFPTLG